MLLRATLNHLETSSEKKIPIDTSDIIQSIHLFSASRNILTRIITLYPQVQVRK